jgi:hypothetical protein
MVALLGTSPSSNKTEPLTSKQLKDDLGFRKEVAIQVGLGFELLSKKIEVGPNRPKIETERVSEMATCV